MRLAAILGSALALAVVSNAGAAGPLETGFLDPGAFTGPNADVSVVRARKAGATLTRVPLFWNAVETATPADPEDPNDPAYDWASLDRQVRNAVRGGLAPMLCITNSPKWAEGPAVGLPGTWPSPAKFAQFSRAAARRYSGTFTPPGQTEPLPRVQYWEAWNEPNAGSNLAPAADQRARCLAGPLPEDGQRVRRRRARRRVEQQGRGRDSRTLRPRLERHPGRPLRCSS